MNNLTISLSTSGQVSASKKRARIYDGTRDNVTTVLVDICEALAEDGHVRFAVGGFGQDSWPVDIQWDLPVVIEQIPAVLDALRHGASAKLGFYEQGIQRVLDIEPRPEGEVTIGCVSMTSWQPQPSTISVTYPELLALLDSLLARFVDCARQCCPELADHPWFRRWAIEGVTREARGEEPDRATLQAALDASGGDVAAAARALGVHRTQLRRWMARHSHRAR